MAGEANRVFKNYTQRTQWVPDSVWLILRGLALGILVGIIGLLTLRPDVGLKIFWALLIPAVPTLLVLAPGLWRQVCPMAFMNQMPRQLGFSLAKTLPQSMQKRAFLIAIVIFLGAIALRKPLLETSPLVLATVLAATLLMAFLGGIIFKGRSGWCGTFCPLGPIQRVYGQAPVVVVNNSYCKTCVGCQSNCYDFNPQATVFNDIDHDDPAYAGQRRFFVAMLPGLILAFFLLGNGSNYGYGIYWAILGGSVLISAGLYQALLSFFDLNAYRLSALFAGIALTTFYFFAAPNALNAFTELTGYVFTPLHFKLSQFYGAGLGLILLVMGLWNQYKVKKAEHSRITGPLAMNPAASQAVKAQFKPSQIVNVHADKPILMPHHLEETPCVVDAQTGVTHAAKSGQTLLDVLEGQGHDLKACCRTGICGADPVLIKEGMNNLSEPSPEELATLRRLGLEGHGRMACSCRLISGSVTVDRRVDQLETLETSGSKAVSQKITFTQGASIPVPQERMTFLSRYTSASPYTYNPSENDKEMPELGRVIIIGNGIAGMSAADELRRLRPDVEIIVLSDEPYHFYNRMALNKVFEGLTDTDNLMMGKVEEYARKRIQIKLKSRVELIDRRRKLIRLNGGQTMLYDKLILATGASASVTHEDFLAHHNAFVLRSADDACEIRDHILNFGCEDAVVIGGGVLGVEAAEALARLGAKVTLIHRANRLMDRQLDEPSALRLAWYLEDLGVRLIMNAQIDRFEGYRHLKAVYFSDGTHISGHIFVACVGTKPNTSLAQKIGLRVQTGVLVNRYMKTSDSHIYAVGDVAELKDETSGLWAVGMMQGQVAAASITGKPMTYEAPRSFMRLKSDGLSVLTYGNVIDISPHAQVLSSPLDAPDYWCVVLEGEQVRGAVFTGPIDTPNPLEGLLGTHDQRLAVIARLRQRTHSSAHDTLAARINRGVEIEHGETTQEEYFDALSEQHIGTKLNTWGETLWNKANQSEASSVSPTIQTWPLISLPQANENPRSTF